MDDPRKREKSRTLSLLFRPFAFLSHPSSLILHPFSFFPTLLTWLRLPGFLSWIAVSFGVAFAYALSFSFCTRAFHSLPAPVWLAGITLSAALGILTRPPALRIILFFLFTIFLCIVRREHQIEICQDLRAWSGDGLPVEVVGKVTSPPMPYYGEYRFMLRIDSLPGASFPALRGRTLNCIAPSKPPQYGRVTVYGVFAPPRIRRNTFEYDEFTAMMAQGVWGRFTAKSCAALASAPSPLEGVAAGFRRVTLAALDKIADYDNRAILLASILDNTEYLSPYIRNIFQKAGIYHLIAIDGLHIVILTTALFFFLGLFRLNRNVSGAIVVALLWAYPLFIGFIPSLLRATIMATAVIAALVFEKKRYGLQALGLAGTALLALSPECLFSPGYQLSFSATFGLIVFMPGFTRIMPRLQNPIMRRAAMFFGSSLAISLICFLATAPILLYHFGVISWFGLIGNVVAVAAMTCSLWAFFAGLLLQMLVPFAAGLPLWVSERFLDVVVGVGRIGDCCGWSQAAYPVTPPEIILFFGAAAIGAAVIRADRLKVYLLVIIGAGAILLPADIIGRRLVRTTEVVRFAVPRGGMLGIRWPAGAVSVVYIGPARSLPPALSAQVTPWIRHSCGNRLDCVLLPRKTAEALNAGANDAVLPFSAAVDTLPEPPLGACRRDGGEDVSLSEDTAFHSVFTPGMRCTCAVRCRSSIVEVRVTVPGLDTVYTLPAAPTARRHLASDATPGSPEEHTALVLRSGGEENSAVAVVPSDHPLW